MREIKGKEKADYKSLLCIWFLKIFKGGIRTPVFSVETL